MSQRPSARSVVAPEHSALLRDIAESYARARMRRRAVAVDLISEYGYTYRAVSEISGIPTAQLHRWVTATPEGG